MIKLPTSTKTQGIIIVSLTYIVFLVVGMLCYKDFGISVDEWDLRVMGFVNLKYLMEILFQKYRASPNGKDFQDSCGSQISRRLYDVKTFFK